MTEFETTSIYPSGDYVGRHWALEGAGILAPMVADHLHPPFTCEEALWKDARRWPEAAAQHSREAARFARIKPHEKVLDIGVGLGGPARMLVDEFGAVVTGFSTAERMLVTAREINAGEQRWRENISLHLHDVQLPLRFGLHDVAWSMNMLYQVPDKAAMLHNVREALRPGGRLMVEDWMLLPAATADDVAELEHHFVSAEFAVVHDFQRLLLDRGFTITAIRDLGEVARSHFVGHVHHGFEEVIRPQLEEAFPEHGAEMSDEWAASMQTCDRLYSEWRMTYLRILAYKLSGC